MNRQLLSILSVIVSLAIGLGLYLYFAKIGDAVVKPVQVVPDNAVCILESNNSSLHLRRFSDMDFMHGLLSNEHLENGMRNLKRYDSLFRADDVLQDWLNGGSVTYSLHVFPNGSTGVMMIAQTSKDAVPESLTGFLEKQEPGRFKVGKRKFNGQELLDFTDFKQGNAFTVAFNKQLLIFSPQGALVELALAKLAKVIAQPPTEDKLAFVKSSGDGLNFYVNYSNIPVWLRGMSNEAYAGAFSIPGTFAERAVYTVAPEEDAVLLRGAAETHATKFQFLDLLNAQAPLENNLRDLIPSSVNFSLTLGFNGYQAFYKNVSEYLMEKNLAKPYKAYIDSLETVNSFAFSEKLAGKIGNHAALLSLNEPGFWKDSTYLIAVEITDVQGMKKLLADMELAGRKRNPTDSLAFVADTSGVPQSPLGSALKFYFTDLLDNFLVSHYVERNGYFFFSNNAPVLKRLQAHWEEGKLLTKEPDYARLVKKMAPGSNLELLIWNENASRYLLNFLNKDWYSIINQNMGAVRRVKQVAIQYAGSNDKVFATQACIRLDVSKTERTEKVWSIALDTTIIGTPQVVYNSKLGNHIMLVQDARFQLYGIDRDGKVLFRQKLEYPLVSGVTAIDMYGNGRQQWVFNTTHHLFIMDEDGNYLSGWPVWIPTGTNYPVLVADPNHDRNYQFYLSGIYFKVSGYNAQGRMLAGWNPKDVWPNLKSGPGMIRLMGTDYLYALNEKGVVNYFTISGGKQAQPLPSDSGTSFIQAVITQPDTGSCVLTALDSNQLWRIVYKGGKEVSRNSWQANGYNSFKLSASGEIVLVGTTRLHVLNEQGEEILYRSASAIQPNLQQVGDGQRLVWFDPIHGELKVEKTNGETHPPFPMKASGPYQIGNLFDDGNTWLVFADASGQLNLYRVK